MEDEEYEGEEEDEEDREIEKQACETTKVFKMPKIIFAKFQDLVPTLKFIIRSAEQTDKLPIAKVCMLALTHIEMRNILEGPGKIASSMEGCYTQIREVIEDKMKHLGNVLLFPPIATNVVMRKYFTPSYEYKPSRSFQHILANILTSSDNPS